MSLPQPVVCSGLVAIRAKVQVEETDIAAFQLRESFWLRTILAAKTSRRHRQEIMLILSEDLIHFSLSPYYYTASNRFLLLKLILIRAYIDCCQT